jgi:hypothetical protein
VAALATLAFSFWAASLGVRARRGDEAARRRHAGLGPVLLALVVANWIGGVATTWWMRPEMELTSSGHFTVGSLMVAVFSAAAIASRWVPLDPRARTIHPLLGATGLALSGFQVFLGLQLLP